MQNPKDSLDPTTAMNMALALMAKAFKFNTIPTNNNQRSLLIPLQNDRNQVGKNAVQNLADLDEIEEVNANCILMANLQQASTSGTQGDKAPVYDSGGSAELLNLIPKPPQVQQNDSNVTSAVSSMEQGEGTVEQHHVPQKVNKTNDLSNPVTSNSMPTTKESNVVNNEKLIAPEIFRINHFKAFRVNNFVPNKHVKASVKTKPITISQPHVITKEDVNSNTCGFSPKDIDNTTRTRRP
uniref:Uncharacterized protein n=1 Tax=Tanacetum cinerariifolium TaxID=118510 RepID=A0A6L2LQ73_TANCI|nr:hypothetical protein [Tanacetum cinerariifolium]